MERQRGVHSWSMSRTEAGPQAQGTYTAKGALVRTPSSVSGSRHTLSTPAPVDSSAEKSVAVQGPDQSPVVCLPPLPHTRTLRPARAHRRRDSPASFCAQIAGHGRSPPQGHTAAPTPTTTTNLAGVCEGNLLDLMFNLGPEPAAAGAHYRDHYP